MAHMTNTAQWAVVIGFVGVGLLPRIGSSPSDGRPSQNGGSTDRLAYSFHALPHRANVKVSNLKGALSETVGGAPFCEDLPSLGLEPVLG